MPKKDGNCREKLENLLTDHLCRRIPGWKSRKWKDPKFKSTKWSESNQKQTGDHHTNLAWKRATHLQSSLWNNFLKTLLTWCLHFFPQLFKINHKCNTTQLVLRGFSLKFHETPLPTFQLQSHEITNGLKPMFYYFEKENKTHTIRGTKKAWKLIYIPKYLKKEHD